MKIVYYIICFCIVMMINTETYAKPQLYKILRVIDGDTVEFEAPFLPEELHKKLSVRLLGVDTPEKGIFAKCPKENELSLRAKDFTHDKIVKAKQVLVDIKKWDKYGGRVLGYVIVDGKNLSDILIENNYAVPYDGKKKTKDWCK